MRRETWATGGVYVLVGTSAGRPALRPGETGDLRRRLGEHAAKPPLDSIERFVVFRRAGDRSFDSAEFGYLEGLLHALSDEVDWDFPGTPSHDETLPEAQKEDLRELFKVMKKILVALGIPIPDAPAAEADPEAVYDLKDVEPPDESATETDTEQLAATVTPQSPAAPPSEMLFPFEGFGRKPGLTHLRTFRPVGKDPVVIAAELLDNPGTSITNAAELLAAQVVSHFPELANAHFVEYWPPRGQLPRAYHLLSFGRMDDNGTLRFTDPAWTPIDPQTLREETNGGFEELVPSVYDQAWVGQRLAALAHE